jgi:hypothetical protein
MVLLKWTIQMRLRRLDLDQSIAWELGDDVPNDSSDFGFDLLPTYVSTQDVYDYLDTVNTQIGAVQRDIETNSAMITSDLKKNWSDYVDQWRPFYDRERKTGHFWFIGSTMENIDTFASKLRSFQTSVNTVLSANSIKPSAPDVTVNKAEASAIESQKTVNVIKSATIAVAVIVGSILIFKAFEYVPKPRKTVQ